MWADKLVDVIKDVNKEAYEVTSKDSGIYWEKTVVNTVLMLHHYYLKTEEEQLDLKI